jgi:hypothetical protein
MDWLSPDLHPDHPATLAWRAHVEAGRIGAALPVDPAIAGNRDRTAALFAALRRGVRS